MLLLILLSLLLLILLILLLLLLHHHHLLLLLCLHPIRWLLNGNRLLTPNLNRLGSHSIVVGMRCLSLDYLYWSLRLPIDHTTVASSVHVAVDTPVGLVARVAAIASVSTVAIHHG